MSCHCTSATQDSARVEWSEVNPLALISGTSRCCPCSSNAIPIRCQPVTWSCTQHRLAVPNAPKKFWTPLLPQIRPNHNLSLQHRLPPLRSFLSFLGIPFLHSLHLLPRLLHFCLRLPNRPLQLLHVHRTQVNTLLLRLMPSSSSFLVISPSWRRC